MELTREQAGDVLIVKLPGRNLDASNAGGYKRSFGLAKEGFSKIALDLSEVEFVDSSGLGALLSSLRDLHADGGNMKLFGVQKPVQVLFELVRMHRVFEIHTSQADALASFSA